MGTGCLCWQRLLYGFSPLLLVSLSNVWLMVGMAPVAPLVVLVLDELLFRQRRSAVKVGVGLGLLVFLQFFLGIEMLLIMAISVAIGLVLILIFAAWRQKEALALRAPRCHWADVGSRDFRGAPGLPSMVRFGRARSSIRPDLGRISISPVEHRPQGLLPTGARERRAVASRHLAGGYQGPFLSNQYIGLGLALVLVLGLIIWRKDRKLWLFGAVGFCTLVISLGCQQQHAPSVAYVLEYTAPAKHLADKIPARNLPS